MRPCRTGRPHARMHAGYICGGIVATYMSWRWGFILEGLAIIPFVVFALTAQPLKLQGSAAPGSAGALGAAPAPLAYAYLAPAGPQGLWALTACPRGLPQWHHAGGSIRHQPGRVAALTVPLGHDIGAATAPSRTPCICMCMWALPMHACVLLRVEEGYAKRHFKDVVAEFWTDVKTVFSQRVWVHVNMAYTLYVAVLGVYAFWGPQAGKALFFPPDDKSAQADYVFGGVTVLTGVLGSLAGGIFLDRAGEREEGEPTASPSPPRHTCLPATLSGDVRRGVRSVAPYQAGGRVQKKCLRLRAPFSYN